MIPGYQGTSENATYRIVTNGFGTTATLDDGYYGRGIYFTSSMKYAAKYATPTKRGKVFLLSLVITGNVFPVTEHPFIEKPDGVIEYMSDENGKTKPVPNPQGYLGKACRAGHQSHYTVVDSRNISTAFPFKEEKIDLAITSNEIVIFDSTQILPLFLIYTNEFTSGQTTSQDITQGFHFSHFFSFIK